MSHRRDFLRTAVGTSVVSLGATAPEFLCRAAWGQEESNDDRILVVIQLSGGNDGLNTVIPYGNDVYRSKRPTLAIGKDEVLAVNDDLGFHPSMSGIAEILEADKLSVIQNVGYANPNRSHFESMDIWHTCQRKNQTRSSGWLGRFIDQRSEQEQDSGAVHLGQEEKPLALASEKVQAISIASIERFQLQLTGKGDLKREEVDRLLGVDRTASSNLLDFVQANTRSAVATSDRITKALAAASTTVAYPETNLGKKLDLAAKMIRSGFPTQVYYVTLGGFDTHAQQAAAHNGLLREWSGALQAFMNDMESSGQGKRVLTMTFSEFGRRVQENASKGTDHGAAAPMFLAGPVQSGLHGELPNMDDLNDGDIRHRIDFRQVYATVLEDWLGWDAADVIGTKYEKLPILKV